MAMRKTMHLNESELLNLVSECVKKVLSEGQDRHRPGYYKEYYQKRKQKRQMEEDINKFPNLYRWEQI